MSQCLKWRGGDDEQVSENLVASSFQFFTRLAAVFAEEVGDFGMFRAILQTSDGQGKSLCA